MRPFDEISGPTSLGAEDDILLLAHTSTSTTHEQPHNYAATTPKWLRPTTPTTTISSLLTRIYSTLRHLTRRWTPVITSLLRPRLTIRYVVLAALALYITYRLLLTSQPLLSSRLPPYTGPYAVGALDVELPLPPSGSPVRVSDVTFKGSGGEPAFEVETVLFTLYYPTARGSSSPSPSTKGAGVEEEEEEEEGHERLYWVPRPISATARGYARFGGLDNFVVRNLIRFGLWATVGGIQIPARVAAPLIPSHPLQDDASDGKARRGRSDDDENKRKHEGKEQGDFDLGGAAVKLPVMIFSHGMASSRTDYTHYLGELASRGIVVAALEHRDGSSPASAILDTPESSIDDPAVRWRYAFRLQDLDTSSSSGSSSSSTTTTTEEGRERWGTPALKRAQLSFREVEIHAAARLLRDLDAGSRDIFTKNPRAPSSPSSPSSSSSPSGLADTFKGRLDVSNLTLAGHSYGATGVLRALRPTTDNSSPSPSSNNSSSSFLPTTSSSSSSFRGAVVLDPGKSSGPLNGDVSVPTVICHSSSWSRPGASLFFGRPHFDVVRDIAEGLNLRAGNTSCAAGGAQEEEEEDEDEERQEALTGGDEKSCSRFNPDAKGWFLTSLGTTHPSITDAPVLEPLLLSWTTGSTMDAQQGIRQYVDLTRDFVAYQRGRGRQGLLALSGREDDGVISRDYDPKHNDRMPQKWSKYWQLHVAPDK